MKWNICSIDKIDNDVAKLFLCSSSNSSRTTVGYAVYEDIDDALKMVNVNDIERNFCISLCLKKDGKKNSIRQKTNKCAATVLFFMSNLSI